MTAQLIKTKFTEYNAFIFVGLFAILQFSLVFLRPDLGLSRDLISDYGVGKHSWVFSLSLIFLTLAKVFLIFKLEVRNTIANKISRFGIAASAISAFLIAFFPTDVTANKTDIGLIHNFSAVTTFTATAIFFMALAYNFKSYAFSKIRFFVAIVNATILIALGLAPVEIKGLIERLMMCSIIIGLSYYSLYLKKSGR